MIQHKQYKRRAISAKTSEASGDVIVSGTPNNIDELEGLMDKINFILRLPKTPPLISTSAAGHEIVAYSAPPSKEARELRQLSVKLRAYISAKQREDTLRKGKVIQKLRIACTTYAPKFRRYKVQKKRVISWWQTVYLTTAAMNELGLSKYDRSISVDWEKVSAFVSTPPPLGATKKGRFFKVQRSKTVTYMKSIKMHTGKYRRVFDSARFRAAKAQYLQSYVGWRAQDDAHVSKLRDRINWLKAQLRQEYKSCVATRNISRVGTLDLKEMRDAYYKAFAFPDRRYYPAFTGTPIDEYGDPYGYPGASVSGMHNWDDVDHPPVVWAYRPPEPAPEWQYYPPETDPVNARKRAMGEELGGRIFKVIEDDQYYDRDQWESAKLALMNLDIGHDELSGFNAARSSAELKDLGQTGRQARDFLRWLRAPTIKLNPATTIKAAAAAHLAYKFAVAPTVSDINTLLKNTRQTILGIRRGLLSYIGHARLINENGLTVRKYVNNVSSSNITRLFGPYFPSKFVMERSIDEFIPIRNGRLVLTHEQCERAKLPIYIPTSSFVGRREPAFGVGFRDLLDRLPDEVKPRWAVLPKRELLFARFTAAELERALDISSVENQVELLRLPMNVWELYPLSFVVDWFLTTHTVMQNIQNAISSWQSDIMSDSGIWGACQLRLALIYPVYEHKNSQATSTGKFNPEFYIRGGNEVFEIYSTPHHNFQVLKGVDGLVLRNEVRLKEIRKIETGNISFARSLQDKVDISRIFFPQFKVNLGLGQISTLCEMILSSL